MKYKFQKNNASAVRSQQDQRPKEITTLKEPFAKRSTKHLQNSTPRWKISKNGQGSSRHQHPSYSPRVVIDRRSGKAPQDQTLPTMNGIVRSGGWVGSSRSRPKSGRICGSARLQWSLADPGSTRYAKL
ncbi:hypothetical protein Taro_005642 [Colocasia esculenta]|uniref:Uncharacterized protein n=1 Tax=Colocasia esculenta TaxID=4460 RepID=A0A843TV71_COLES|nr:hypothetical protein [Colocasia esculenta]